MQILNVLKFHFKYLICSMLEKSPDGEFCLININFWYLEVNTMRCAPLSRMMRLDNKETF